MLFNGNWLELLVGPKSRSQEAINESGSLEPRCHGSWEPGASKGANSQPSSESRDREPTMSQGSQQSAREPAIGQGASSESESQEPAMTGSQQ